MWCLLYACFHYAAVQSLGCGMRKREVYNFITGSFKEEETEKIHIPIIIVNKGVLFSA